MNRLIHIKNKFSLPLLVLLMFLVMTGCNKSRELAVPSVGPNSILTQTDPLQAASKAVMEGIWSVSSGYERFGEKVVVKWYRDKMSVYCSDGTYMILSVGQLDSVVMVEGYWRYAYGDNTGLVTGYIGKDEGGKEIVSGNPVFSSIILRGAFGNSGNELNQPLVLSFQRPFSDAVKNTRFDAVAHRSGGRTSDRLPVSENSIPMIAYTGYFGSTGIEIDVQLTKDGIPVLYHDKDINIRLTQKGPLSGPIANFTYEQLYNWVLLIHGEHIPKLEDALTYVVDSTDLRFVWLDMKENVTSMSAVIPIQQMALARAQAAGRDLNIYVGLPSQDAINDFMNQPGYLDIPSLCELTVDDVRMVNAKVWGPRWTEGTQNDLVDQMHAEGRKAYCWTIDEPAFISQYIQEGHFDGLLTNFPSVVQYYHYTR